VHLPGYPFARKRCWIDGAAETNALAARLEAATAPAADGSLRFELTIAADEPFVADHRVAGQAVLPAVASLELGRAALEKAREQRGAPPGRLRVERVVWQRPIVVPAEGRRLVVLVSGWGEGLRYEVRDGAGGSEGDEPFSMGEARLVSAEAPARLDLAAMRAGATDVTGALDRYHAAFEKSGLVYGPAYRVVDRLVAGPAGVLAELSAAGAGGAAMLDPCVVDAALQTCMALVEGEGEEAIGLPFALDALEVFAPAPPRVVSWVRRAPAGSALDLDLCGEDGAVWARLRGLSARRRQQGREAPPAGVHVIAPVWNPISRPSGGAPVPGRDARVVVCGGSERHLAAVRALCPNVAALPGAGSASAADRADHIARLGPIDHLVWIAPQDDAGLDSDRLIGAQKDGVVDLFALMKALLAAGHGGRPLGWTVLLRHTQRVLPGELVRPAHASVVGLMGSAAKEYPHWNVRVIDGDDEADGLLEDAFRAPIDPRGDVLACRGGQWFRQQWAGIGAARPGATAYRRNGLYVVVGGAGGLGEAWTRHLAEHHAARVVWIGRRPQDAAIEERIARVARFGPAPEYIAADASDRSALRAARDRIVSKHGPVHGLVHSALVLSDRSLAGMDEARFLGSLRAKVDISVRMAEVFAGEPLDFVLFFSSLQSFAKAAGQSNYAAGCTFKDAFAARLRQAWRCPVKVMNWGYWGSAGVVADAAYRARMARANVGSIEPADGMWGLDVLLGGPHDQLALYRSIDGRPVAELAPVESLTTYAADLAIGLDELEGVFSTAGDAVNGVGAHRLEPLFA
jgi:polyketide synthase PksM